MSERRRIITFCLHLLPYCTLSKIFSGYQLRHVAYWRVNKHFDKHLCYRHRATGIEIWNCVQENTLRNLDMQLSEADCRVTRVTSEKWKKGRKAKKVKEGRQRAYRHCLTHQSTTTGKVPCDRVRMSYVQTSSFNPLLRKLHCHFYYKFLWVAIAQSV